MSKRSAPKKRRSPKYKKYVIFALSLLVSLLFLFSIFGIAFFRRGLVAALSQESTLPLYDDNFMSFAYIVVDDLENEVPQIQEGSFVFVDKSSKKIIKYTIPQDMKVEVVGKFLEEDFSKLYAISLLNTNDKPQYIINASLQKIFGYPVERHVFVSKDMDKELGQSFWSGDLLGMARGFDLIEQSTKYSTNFSVSELYDLMLFINSLPEDRHVDFILSKTYQNDSTLIDDQIQDITFDSKIAREDLSIAVLNGTNISGLASSVSRMIKNLGGRVVAMQNSEDTYSKSVIVTDKPNSVSAQLFSNLFGITDILAPSQLNMDQEYMVGRADLTIIIGVDLSSRL